MMEHASQTEVYLDWLIVTGVPPFRENRQFGMEWDGLLKVPSLAHHDFCHDPGMGLTLIPTPPYMDSLLFSSVPGGSASVGTFFPTFHQGHHQLMFPALS